MSRCGSASWFAALMVCLLLLAGGLGCRSPDEVVRLPRWSLVQPGSSPLPVELPQHIDHALPDHPSHYVLRTDVELPSSFRGERLTLVIPYLPALGELWVDGRRFVPLDTPGVSEYRSAGPQRFAIDASATASERISLELRVHNTWTQAGWIDSVPRLSATPQGDRRFLIERALNRVFETTGLAAILLVCFSYVVVFASSTRRAKNAGWFALEAATGSMYPAFVMGVTQVMFGVYDAAVMGFALSVATVGNVYFVHGYGQLGRPHPIWRWGLAVSLVAYVFNPGPFEMTYGAAPTTIIIMLANAIYQTVLLVRLLRRRPRARLHEWVVPLAWPLAHVFAAADFAAWAGLGELFGGIRAGALGIGFIATLQTLALSREYILSLERTDRLNNELARRVRAVEAKHAEVQHLNDELRRQIEGRSAQLVRALTRLASTDPGPAELTPGELLDGRYRVLRRVGRGGMGAVYEVQRVADQRRLALKLLTGTPSRSDMARFAREAQLVSQLDHENVVSIVDMDVAQNGAFYLVMEFVEGLSLRHHRAWYRQRGWALAVIHGTARGLEAIHARGMVHRDLKPSNVLLTRDAATDRPIVKIGDFGVSRMGVVEDSSEVLAAEAAATLEGLEGLEGLEDPESSRQATPDPSTRSLGDSPQEDGETVEMLTRTGVVVGTPLYMAPELAVLGSRSARPSSDIFSLGVIAYELLTGERPFEQTSFGRGLPVIRRPPLGERLSDLDRDLADCLEACLSMDPRQRPTAAEIVQALERIEIPRDDGLLRSAEPRS